VARSKRERVRGEGPKRRRGNILKKKDEKRDQSSPRVGKAGKINGTVRQEEVGQQRGGKKLSKTIRVKKKKGNQQQGRKRERGRCSKSLKKRGKGYR